MSKPLKKNEYIKTTELRDADLEELKIKATDLISKLRHYIDFVQCHGNMKWDFFERIEIQFKETKWLSKGQIEMLERTWASVQRWG